MEQRLKILFDAGVINQEIYRGMLNVIDKLENHWHLILRHAQGEMLITHMASALMRAVKNEDVEPIDEALFAEIKNSNIFSKVLTIHCNLMQEFRLNISENEEGYLLANLYGLYMLQPSHSIPVST